MAQRLHQARHRYRTWLTPSQQRGARVLGLVSMVSVLGLAVTGVLQLFVHASDPGWYGYVPGQGSKSSAGQSGLAELHSLFGTAVGVSALVGGAWFAYRILFDVPKPAAIALILAIIGMITGSVMRFNLVKLRGKSFEEAGTGYGQVFGGDLEYVVTDRFELAPLAIRLWSIGHVITWPLILAVIWLGLPPQSADSPK